ncbi:hypothetical protein Agub_g2404, partial [Astrephomene gubernaculifera]
MPLAAIPVNTASISLLRWASASKLRMSLGFGGSRCCWGSSSHGATSRRGCLAAEQLGGLHRAHVHWSHNCPNSTSLRKLALPGGAGRPLMRSQTMVAAAGLPQSAAARLAAAAVASAAAVTVAAGSTGKGQVASSSGASSSHVDGNPSSPTGTSPGGAALEGSPVPWAALQLSPTPSSPPPNPSSAFSSPSPSSPSSSPTSSPPSCSTTSLDLIAQRFRIAGRTFRLITPRDVDAVMDMYLERDLHDADPYWTRAWPSAISLAA